MYSPYVVRDGKNPIHLRPKNAMCWCSMFHVHHLKYSLKSSILFTCLRSFEWKFIDLINFFFISSPTRGCHAMPCHAMNKPKGERNFFFSNCRQKSFFLLKNRITNKMEWIANDKSQAVELTPTNGVKIKWEQGKVSVNMGRDSVFKCINIDCFVQIETEMLQIVVFHMQNFTSEQKSGDEISLRFVKWKYRWAFC